MFIVETTADSCLDYIFTIIVWMRGVLKLLVINVLTKTQQLGRIDRG